MLILRYIPCKRAILHLSADDIHEKHETFATEIVAIGACKVVYMYEESIKERTFPHSVPGTKRQNETNSESH